MKNTRPLDAFARFVVEHPLLVILVSVLLVSGFGSRLPTLRSDVSVRKFFRATDPAILRYDAMLETFGSDDFVVVAFEVADAFSPETLRLVDDVTRAVREHPSVEEVVSLTSVETIRGEDDSIYVGDLFSAVPPPRAEVERARADIRSNRLLQRTIVSDDERVVLVSSRLKPLADEALKGTAAREIRELVVGRLDRPVIMTGRPVIDEAFRQLSARDLSRLLPLSIAVLGALLLLVFRSILAMVLSLLVFGLSAVAAMGALALCGGRFHTLTSAVPLVMLPVSIAATIHVLAASRRMFAPGVDQRAALANAVREVMPPTSVSSATTAIGCASFGVSPLPPVQEFGLAAAFGAVMAGALSLTFLPAAMALLRQPRGSALRVEGAFWARVGTASVRHHRAVLVGAVATSIGLGFGALRLEASEDVLRHFPENADVPRWVAFMEDHFGGGGSLQTIFAGEAGDMLEPEVVRAMDDYARFMTDGRLVDHSIGFSDFLVRTGEVLGEAEGSLPADRATIEQFVLFLDGPEADVRKFLNEDRSMARVSLSVPLRKPGAHRTVAERARGYLAERTRGTAVEWYLTGSSDLNVEMVRRLVTTELGSLALAIPVMAFATAVLLRRLRLLPIVLAANLLPIGATLGVMGLLSVSIDLGTVLIPSIALGLIVDDAVYLLNRLRREASSDRPLEDLVAISLGQIGPAIFRTSLIGAAGFLVFAVADFRPVARLGALTAFTLVTAFLTNVVLVPALLAVGRRWIARDLRHAAA